MSIPASGPLRGTAGQGFFANSYLKKHMIRRGGVPSGAAAFIFTSMARQRNAIFMEIPFSETCLTSYAGYLSEAASF
jgi:hypothetical protein